jgi:ABC-type glutathione transport system ATPase component
MSVLDVDKLTVSLGILPVVRGISFSLPRGGTLGLVGESGSGKSMTALALMQLLPAGARTGGAIRLNGEEIANADEARLCALRGDRMAMIFQEPMTSLNPVHAIGDQIAEPMLIHRKQDATSARRTALTLLERVGIPDAPARLGSYPHQLSGGQRQRINLARALSVRPDLLLLDEPFSALDAITRQTLQDELLRLWHETRTTMLFVTHDLDEAVYLADRVVLLGGKPAGIVRDFPVALPRPRERDTAHFSDTVREIRAALSESVSDGAGI